MRYTVFGAGGFIGTHLVEHLRNRGAEVLTPPRGNERAAAATRESLGHVIYAIGMTGNFRSRPFDTVEAHVSLLADLLQTLRCESFLYLSSTRVYAGLPGPVDEETPVTLMSTPDRIYDLTKLTGEALVLAQNNPTMRVARLSNVIGSGLSQTTFLGSVIAEILSTGQVTIGEAPESNKDYIDIEDVVNSLPGIAESGRERLYCVVSGRQTTHQEIADLLSDSGRVRFQQGGTLRRFPPIRRNRIESEFGFKPKEFTESLAGLIGPARM